MRAYHALLRNILYNGNFRGDRTGTGTQSLFGAQVRCDLQEGFPLLTTKKMSFHNIAVELCWFLKGDTNIKYLLEHNCHIWSDDAYRMYKRAASEGLVKEIAINKEDFEHQILINDGFARKWGDLGPVYGAQWRHWDINPMGEASAYHIDQIKLVIESIKKNPESRRHIVSAWNPADVDSMALPPCHCLFQFYVADGKLSCHLYQRSADVFLGVPYNLASYALLTHIIAYQCRLEVGELITSYGDVHIYNNHRAQVIEQMSRKPRKLPKLTILDSLTEGSDVREYEPGDFVLEDYNPYPPIKGELSVGV